MWCGDCWASHLELYVPLLPQAAASSPIHAEVWVTNDTCSGADFQQQGKREGPQSSVQKLQEDNSSLCFHSQKNSWGESYSYVFLWTGDFHLLPMGWVNFFIKYLSFLVMGLVFESDWSKSLGLIQVLPVQVWRPQAEGHCLGQHIPNFCTLYFHQSWIPGVWKPDELRCLHWGDPNQLTDLWHFR